MRPYHLWIVSSSFCFAFFVVVVVEVEYWQMYTFFFYILAIMPVGIKYLFELLPTKQLPYSTLISQNLKFRR